VAGGQILTPEGDREPDVEKDCEQKADPSHPKERAEVLKLRGVGIDGLGAEEDGEIPEQVGDDKEDEDDAGDGDYPLPPDRGGKKRKTAGRDFFGRDRAAHEFFL